MSESAKQAFNDRLRGKAADQPEEKKAAPEELVGRAGAAIEELQDVIAELAGVLAGDDPEEGKTK